VLACLLGSTGAINQGEYDCEEAHAHLTKCCPGFHTSSQYCGNGDACSGVAIDSKQSECVLGMTCDDLVKKGVCDRAMRAQPSDWSTVETTDGGTVCP